MRSRRVKLEGRYIYHCMSRVIERQFVLGDQEKEYFRGLMRRCEGFCGVRIVTYAILDNHFHILVEVPALKPLGEKALMERMRLLYSPEYMEEVRAQWALWRKQGHEKLVKRDQARYQARMGDVSEFMKTLKQRFTQWYNRQDGRKGTLWEGRFKSVLVQGKGHPLVTMAAYIDLNAVRAGIVEDPREYRWCGYGEAVGGGPLARKGLAVVTRSFGHGSDWRVVSRVYRRVLFGAGEESGRDEHGRPIDRGFSKKKVAQVIALPALARVPARGQAGKNGELSQFELLRCRVRYFSDGVVLGSKGFVNEVFEAYRGKAFHTKRKEGARAMKGGDWAGLCTARDLRMQPIQVGT